MSEADVAVRLKKSNVGLKIKPVADKFGSGIPDRIAKFRDSSDVWFLELKFLKRLPKVSCKVGLKKKQAGWCEDWSGWGGRCAVVVGVSEENGIAVFFGDFMDIATNGIRRQDFKIIRYDELSSELRKMM